jgi:hypothetical protein
MVNATVVLIVNNYSDINADFSIPIAYNNKWVNGTSKPV